MKVINKDINGKVIEDMSKVILPERLNEIMVTTFLNSKTFMDSAKEKIRKGELQT